MQGPFITSGLPPNLNSYIMTLFWDWEFGSDLGNATPRPHLKGLHKVGLGPSKRLYWYSLG